MLVSQNGSAQLADFGSTELKEYTLKFSQTTTTASLTVRWAVSSLAAQDGHAVIFFPAFRPQSCLEVGGLAHKQTYMRLGWYAHLPFSGGVVDDHPELDDTSTLVLI